MLDPDLPIFSVAELNEAVRHTLESHFPPVIVEGEISNFAAPPSGHFYFTLKDNDAQIRCAMFRGSNRQLKTRPENGMQVIIRGNITIYAARGDYQLIVDYLEPQGEGKLRLEFEKLKNKLEKEGLFQPQLKKTVPVHIRTIGVITSPDGAAIKDILSILKRRYPLIQVIIYPTLVQGKTAAPQIVAAIHKANRRQECDVLVIGRGGGSLEDLWSFNEEIVARAIHSSEIPTVSAVGHEIDFTIADFVADVRAPTPSAAAEILSPKQEDVIKTLQSLEQQLTRNIMLILRQKTKQLELFTRSIKHPGYLIRELQQKTDEQYLKLLHRIETLLSEAKHTLQQLNHNLSLHNPSHHINTFKTTVNQYTKTLYRNMHDLVKQKQQHLTTLVSQLDALSPLKTMTRGFSITLDSKTGKIIDSVKQLKPEQTVQTRLQDGSFTATVTKISTEKQ